MQPSRLFVLAVLASAVMCIPLPAQQLVQTGNQAPASSQMGKTPALGDARLAEGWLSLFDGESLFGWQPVTRANWHVENGEIRVSDGEKGLLRTTTQFDDFELELEFQSGDRTNSGVFLRTSPQPIDVNLDCYELNIAQRMDHKFPTGSLVNRIATDTDFPTGQWCRLRVAVNGPAITVWIDEKLAVEYVDPKPLGRGFIGLQYNSGTIAFRNIRLRPLNVPEMKLNPALAGWSQAKIMASEFSVTEQGELKVVNGRGQLETTEQYADFIFSMSCRTNAPGLNSGIFFRCVPGELMNGYESQIQNQYRDADRTQPIDCGTGGIFNRVSARRVNADDQQWFSKSIITTGPHISVWVNGYQVTDWTDQRAANPNPRNGLRLTAGSIIIQGHDPTTDILFKEIRVRELAERGK